MQYPYFYTQVSPIQLYDPLSDFLGAFNEGKLTVSYLECVKLAGHSCPTVAGAYLMAKEGLKALYRNELPQRGAIKLEMKTGKATDTSGVTANIIAYIIGASDVGGFKGIQGNFSRDNLLFFNADIPTEVKLTRLDTEESVNLAYDPSNIKPNENMMSLMNKYLNNLASKEEQENFKKLWQERVEKILQNADKVITTT